MNMPKLPPLPEVGGFVYDESGLMLSASEEAAVERLLLAYGRAVAEAKDAEIAELRAERERDDVAFELLVKEASLLRAERDALRKDAERYRWLRDRLIAADFDYGDGHECVLVFSFPGWVGVGGNCDQNIDAALATKEKNG